MCQEKVEGLRYNSIDLVKFIAAILVVAIHTSPFSSFNINLHNGFSIITKLAVPFFFVSSGFLFFSKLNIGNMKLDSNTKALKKYVVRIFLLYCSWGLIYFIFNIKYVGLENMLNIKSFMILIRDFFFVGYPEILWYLPALIFSVVLIFALLRYMSIEKIILISFVFYFIGLSESSYYKLVSNVESLGVIFSLYNKIFYTTRNGLFFGFLFVALGAYIANNKNISCRSNKAYFRNFIISMILLTIECSIVVKLSLNNGMIMWIFLVPATVYLFLFIMNLKLPDSSYFKVLRELSTLVYVSHGLFLIILPNILKECYENSFTKFITVLLCSLTLSVVIRKLNIKSNFKYLY